jgi:hypothetical protein
MGKALLAKFQLVGTNLGGPGAATSLKRICRESSH